MALEDVSKLLCHSSVAVSSAHPPLVFLVDGLLRCRRCPLPFGVIPCPLPPLLRQSVHFFEGSFPTGQLFQVGDGSLEVSRGVIERRTDGNRKRRVNLPGHDRIDGE